MEAQVAKEFLGWNLDEIPTVPGRMPMGKMNTAKENEDTQRIQGHNKTTITVEEIKKEHEDSQKTKKHNETAGTTEEIKKEQEDSKAIKNYDEAIKKYDEAMETVEEIKKMVKKWEREKKKQERIIQSLATTNLELGREIKRLTKENKMKQVTNQEGGSDSPKKKFKGEKEDEKKSSSNEREMRIEMGEGWHKRRARHGK